MPSSKNAARIEGALLAGYLLLLVALLVLKSSENGQGESVVVGDAAAEASLVQTGGVTIISPTGSRTYPVYEGETVVTTCTGLSMNVRLPDVHTTDVSCRSRERTRDTIRARVNE